ncbi:hypothetical protein GCM10010969_07350 [Saccharibacillus kuerlensis]|uniref:Uncharacterized protein n=1 Tax=Saccharibacillus kuerlensis TaxID=459527 RepID=A0ABQ2KU87_9BACL|nr:hypothetical protein GCM10010969_07350 [Saccharibacillus kuerlensis]
MKMENAAKAFFGIGSLELLAVQGKKAPPHGEAFSVKYQDQNAKYVLSDSKYVPRSKFAERPVCGTSPEDQAVPQAVPLSASSCDAAE